MMIIQTLPATDTVSFHIERLTYEVQTLKDMVGISNSLIANEISSVNLVLTIVSIIIAVLSAILGWYVTMMYNRIKDMKKDITDKEASVMETSKKVNEINEKIQSDISGLFSQLEEEESIRLLKRLERIPEDIGNLNETLLTRELDNKWFPILKNAYFKLLRGKEADFIPRLGSQSKKNSYLLLFFQHYLGLAVTDKDLQEDIINYFPSGCMCAFENDIEKSTKDLLEALNKLPNRGKATEILAKYLMAVNESRHKDYNVLKDILVNGSSCSALLEGAIQICRNNGTELILFK